MDVRLSILFYSLLLFSANFVGDYSLQIFHFSYSVGTLIMQLVFCGVVLFCERIGQRRTALLVVITAFLNLVIALIINFIFDFSIPAFWLRQEGALGHQFNVILIFTLSYFFTAITMVFMAVGLRILVGQGYLVLRVITLLATGSLIDCVILLPILYYSEPDKYLALWKMISFASVKGSLSLSAMPLTCFAISRFALLFESSKKHRHFFNSQ